MNFIIYFVIAIRVKPPKSPFPEGDLKLISDHKAPLWGVGGI